MNKRPSLSYSLTRELTIKRCLRMYPYGIVVRKGESSWALLKDGWAEQHADSYLNGLGMVILLLCMRGFLPMLTDYWEARSYSRRITLALSSAGGHSREQKAFWLKPAWGLSCATRSSQPCSSVVWCGLRPLWTETERGTLDALRSRSEQEA